MKDEAYPNRPDHPDFWTLSKTVILMDEDATMMGFKWMVDILPMDMDSLIYVADQRALRAIQLGTLGPSLWLDGFMTGARYRLHKSANPVE